MEPSTDWDLRFFVDYLLYLQTQVLVVGVDLWSEKHDAFMSPGMDSL